MLYKIAKKWKFASTRASFLKWVGTQGLREIWMDMFRMLPKDDRTVPCEEDWGESDESMPDMLASSLQRVLQVKHPDSIFLVLDAMDVEQRPEEMDLGYVYVYQLACGNRIGTGLWVDQPALPIAKIKHSWEIYGTSQGDACEFINDFCDALHLEEKYEELFGESPDSFSADYDNSAQERAVSKMVWDRAMRVLERGKKKHNYLVDPFIDNTKFDGEYRYTAPVVIKFDLLKADGTIEE